MKELQKFVEKFGLGISVEALAVNAYHHMRALGHMACIWNDRYLEVDGQKFQFIKSRANGCWKVKAFK